MTRGLFVGVSTLDLIYRVDNFPESNQKIVALDQVIAAGGPASNAAVTYRYLGNEATIVSVIGNHPISRLIKSDLETYSVDILDLDPQRHDSPPVSSIVVTESTGNRAVISINADKFQAPADSLPPNILEGIEVVLIDGHQRTVSEVIAQQAQAKNIPVVLDGGSWKPGLETILPSIDYAICSANFYPPGCHNRADVFDYLQESGITNMAITYGKEPIHYINRGNQGEIKVPPIEAVDTLGAGDIIHGAFCHFIRQQGFTEALSMAAKIAAYSCQFFGTRQWMQDNLKKMLVEVNKLTNHDSF